MIFTTRLIRILMSDYKASEQSGAFNAVSKTQNIQTTTLRYFLRGGAGCGARNARYFPL